MTGFRKSTMKQTPIMKTEDMSYEKKQDAIISLVTIRLQLQWFWIRVEISPIDWLRLAFFVEESFTLYSVKRILACCMFYDQMNKYLHSSILLCFNDYLTHFSRERRASSYFSGNGTGHL